MATPSTETSRGESPFRGLGYYTEQDAEWFFGRETERRTIIANLRAARLTLLYAESGVGKSSLLRAGVAARLRELAQQSARRGATRFVPVVFSAWKDDPVEELIAEIERAANSFSAKGPVVSLPRERLSVAVKAASDAIDATFVIILDQFEEYFGYRSPGDHTERLADELPECIGDPDARVNFLIAIREDAYARLGDLFAGHKVNVYGNYLHLEYLGRAAARSAIEGPIERFNTIHSDEPPVEIEPELTEIVLDAVRRGRLALGHGVQDGLTRNGQPSGPSAEIETPFLQVVMTRLWEFECAQGSRILRKATLDQLGGAEMIVRRHLDDALAALADEELEAATDIFHDLVTPSGARIAHTAADLAKRTGHSRDTVAAVLEKLDDPRIVRPVAPAPGTEDERYEIFHDRLTAPLLDWVAVRDNDRLRHQARSERRRANVFRGLAIISGSLLILAVLAFAFAESQKATATREQRSAQSIQLAASAQATLDSNTELSTLLALRALRTSRTDQAVQALRSALSQLGELTTLRAGVKLNSAAFSPDGKEIVTASDGIQPHWNATLRIWSAISHKLLGTIVEPHAYAIESAAFSPDGKKIITASSDGTAWVLSASTDKRLRTLAEPFGNGLTMAAFSPDGTRIVTTSEDGSAQVWSATSFRLQRILTETGHNPRNNNSEPATNSITSAAFSPDGKKIITASSDGTALVWSATGYRLLRVLAAPGHNSLNSVAFSPNGKEIAAASADGTALVWSAGSYQLLGVLTEPGYSAFNSLAFSPDGKEIVTASADGIARVWSAESYEQLSMLAGHSGGVNAAAFSPSGLMVVTASSDGTAKLWNSAPAEQLGAITEPGRGLDAISGGPPGPANVASAAFSPDEKEIVTASDDGTARIWNTGSYAQLGVVSEPRSTAESFPGGPRERDNEINNAAFSPDGKKIVTASDDGTARIWNTGSYAQLGVVSEPPMTVEVFSGGPREPGNNSIFTAAFSPDGREIVTASNDGTARVWNASTFRQLGVLTEPHRVTNGGAITEPAYSSINSAAFSPDGEEIVTASQDGTARVWSASSHQMLGVLTEPGHSSFASAAFSPDGRDIVTSSYDGTARVWDASTFRQLGMVTEPSTQSNLLVSAAFSPDGTEILTASEDGSSRIWGADSYKLLAFNAEPDMEPDSASYLTSLTGAAFSPDGKEIVTAGLDGIARIWSTELAGSVSTITDIAKKRVTRQLMPSERATYLTGT